MCVVSKNIKKEKIFNDKIIKKIINLKKENLLLRRRRNILLLNKLKIYIEKNNFYDKIDLKNLNCKFCNSLTLITPKNLINKEISTFFLKKESYCIKCKSYCCCSNSFCIDKFDFEKKLCKECL